MRLKSHLQYERNFCNEMQLKGYHTERVAASGRRRGAVCDAVLFTDSKSYLVEVKATSAKKFYLKGQLHGILEVCERHKCLPLLAIYFKSNHSSQGKGKWILKILDKTIKKVTNNDKSDNI